MDKAQAIHSFWSSFGLKAYDENTVPDDANLPYITYEFAQGSYDEPILLSASLWYYSKSWADISQKADEISRYIGLRGVSIPFDDGRIWIVRGQPFAQRRSDENDMIRRIYMNIMVEFISA